MVSQIKNKKYSVQVWHEQGPSGNALYVVLIFWIFSPWWPQWFQTELAWPLGSYLTHTGGVRHAFPVSSLNVLQTSSSVIIYPSSHCLQLKGRWAHRTWCETDKGSNAHSSIYFLLSSIYFISFVFLCKPFNFSTCQLLIWDGLIPTLQNQWQLSDIMCTKCLTTSRASINSSCKGCNLISLITEFWNAVSLPLLQHTSIKCLSQSVFLGWLCKSDSEFSKINSGFGEYTYPISSFSLEVSNTYIITQFYRWGHWSFRSHS